jgi:transposase
MTFSSDTNSSQRAKLREQAKNNPDQQVRDRCAAILLLADGHAPEEVAFKLLSKPVTLEVLAKWVEVFNEKGIPGLLSL